MRRTLSHAALLGATIAVLAGPGGASGTFAGRGVGVVRPGVAREGDLAAACADANGPACAAARAAAAVDLVMDLEELEPNTPGAAEAATDALGIDEPEVQNAALLLLASGTGTRHVTPELVALLYSERPRFRQLALRVAARGDDEALKRAAGEAQKSSEKLPALAVVEPPGMRAPGFPGYPSGRPNPFVEGERAVSFVTDDPPETVLRAFTPKGAPFKPQTHDAFLEANTGSGDSGASGSGAVDEKRMEELQKKMEAAAQKGDMAAITQLSQELQKAITGQMNRLQAQMGITASVPGRLLQPGALPAGARWVVVESTRGHATKAVLAYPDAVSRKTAVVLVWAPS